MKIFHLSASLLGSISFCSTFISPANAEVIWDTFSDKGISPLLINNNKDFIYNNEKIDPNTKPISSTAKFDNEREWKEPSLKTNIQQNKIQWELVRSEDLNFNLDQLNFKQEFNRNYLRQPSTYKEAQILYSQIEPQDEDFPLPLRVSPAFPTTNQIHDGHIEAKVFTLSTFSGGAAQGTGNQNYAFRFDYGLTEDIQLSGFYSTADDPLYSSITAHNAQSTPNYWESLGASLKLPLFTIDKFKAALETSIESWNVTSGSPNIFNSSLRSVSTNNFIGSLSLPISWQANKKLQISLLSGVSFLPEKQGKDQGGEGEFYGKNYFSGVGFSWKPISNITLLSSALIPFGPGNNSFDSNLKFKRNPIISFGLNWDLNPRVGIEGMLTNSFGATPSTGILTIPSANKLGYYAGVRYTPDAIDSPQRELSLRENSLAMGGLTVNTALVPAEGTTQVWGNIDSSENFFGYIGYSPSNILQMDLINIGSFRNIPKRDGEEGKIISTFLNNEGEKTRVGAKFIFSSPIRNAPFWTAARISAGRNRWLSGGQGYLFTELINTWEINNNLALNINPKIAWNGVSTPKGIGIGANIQISRRFQLIPEVNIVDTKNATHNGTLGLRWLFGEGVHLDLYASTAAGLQDIGQLVGTNKGRLGARFNLNY